MTRRLLLIFIIISDLFLVSCNGENISDEPEVSCSEASGLWTVSNVKCNGETKTDNSLVYFLFNSSSTVAQTSGNSDCATTFNWNIFLGIDTPSFEMSGVGKQTCSKNSVEVSSCSNEVNSCFSQLDFTGITNNYTTCVIVGSAMKLSRNVSSVNNPDNLSLCENGQDEIVVLKKASNLNLDPELGPDDKPKGMLRVVGPNPSDFGTLAVGRERTLSFVLNNYGTNLATGLASAKLTLPFQYLGGTFPGTSGTCGATLDPSTTCTIVVKFSPLSVGVFADTIKITYNDQIKNQTLSQGVIGSGSNSIALLNISNGPYYSFGNVPINTKAFKLLTLTNTGGGTATGIQALAMTSPFQFSGGSFPGMGGTCGLTLSAGASCDFEIEFEPLTSESFNFTIELNYSDGFFTQSVKRNVFGIGVP